MDTKKLVERIKNILCTANQKDRRYETAWLSFEDDLTGRERYVLNVKTGHTVSSCYEETRLLTELLWRELDTENLRMIARIAVYDTHNNIHCWSEDILLFESMAVC